MSEHDYFMFFEFLFSWKIQAYTFDLFILVLVVEYHYRVPQLGGM